MGSLTLKLVSLALILTGEFLAIFVEINSAKMYAENSTWIVTFSKSIIFILVGSSALLLGYMLGYKGFKNIWIISAISITAILILEPILNYTIFHQLPTKGALTGLILGAAGFAAALLL